MSILRLTELDIKGRRLLIREDLNAPLKHGRVAGDARLRAALPTLTGAVERGATVMVMSHLGRPEEGAPIAAQPDMTLAPVAERLAQLTGLKVRLVDDYLDGFEPGAEDMALFENVRINVGEKDNDEALAKKLAALADIFVMDAFAVAHRAHASTAGVARFAPVACAGPLLTAELDALARALADPARPLVAVVGGNKVSTKLEVLNTLVRKVDSLIVGGGIANTFLAAAGVAVGRSLMEPELLETAGALLETGRIVLPTDVVVAGSITADAEARVRHAQGGYAKGRQTNGVADDEMILDLGPESVAAACELMAEAGTILWNGPVGVAEFPQFAAGTGRLAASIAESDAFSLAGGGDTIAAIDRFGVSEGISCISTGGGAFLEFVEGRTLPAIAALEARGG